MLKVFFTIDVEIWCDGWDRIDEKFNDSFRQYVYGPTPKGQFGLPFILKVLSDNGLLGVFFVEPLFSLRFGEGPLSEIINLITGANQSVELHLHTEWVDEAVEPPLTNTDTKRQYLRCFSLEEQIRLIKVGKSLLLKNGVDNINAFRAGSFGFNTDTLSALKANDIPIDCSYNSVLMGDTSGLSPGITLVEPIQYNGVFEIPLTVFYDWPNHLRPLQVCACSVNEMESVLWKSLKAGREQVCILFHNFELLNAEKKYPDKFVLKRFIKLCEFLNKNRDCFEVVGFKNFECRHHSLQPSPVKSSVVNTFYRYFEQTWSRLS